MRPLLIVLKAILKIKTDSMAGHNVTHHERINYDEMACDTHWLYRDKLCLRHSVEQLFSGYPFDKMIMKKDGLGGYRYPPRFILEKESDTIILSADGKHYEFLSPFSEAEEPEPKTKISLNVPVILESLDRAVQKAVEFGAIKNYGKNGEIMFAAGDWLGLILKVGIWVPDGLLAELEKGTQGEAPSLLREMRMSFLTDKGSMTRQVSGLEERLPLAPLGTDSSETKIINSPEVLDETDSIKFIENLKIYCHPDNVVEIMIQIPKRRPITCNPNYLGFESQNTKEWTMLINLLRSESGTYFHSKKTVKDGGNKDIWRHIKSKLIESLTDKFNLNLPDDFKLFVPVDGKPGIRKSIFQIHRLREMNDNPYCSFDKTQIEQELKRHVKFPEEEKTEKYLLAFRWALKLGIPEDVINSWLD